MRGSTLVSKSGAENGLTMDDEAMEAYEEVVAEHGGTLRDLAREESDAAFDVAVSAARVSRPMVSGYRILLHAVKCIATVLDRSAPDPVAMVLLAWVLFESEYQVALDYSGLEPTGEWFESFSSDDGFLWDALHEATGAVVDGNPERIKFAMDALRQWWEVTATNSQEGMVR